MSCQKRKKSLKEKPDSSKLSKAHLQKEIIVVYSEKPGSKGSPNLRAIALMAIAQGYRPKIR